MLFISSCDSYVKPNHDQEDKPQQVSLVNNDAMSGGEVTQIIDGDTFVLTHTNGEREKINLRWIDAPEKEQPFGREAKQFLTDLLLHKSITYSAEKEVLAGNNNVNQLMLQKGLAWLEPAETGYQQYFAYSEMQTQAMNNLQGLWGLEHQLRIPPWIWRQQATQRTEDTMRQKYLMEQRLVNEREKSASGKQRN